jgi:UDP-N-acetylglucosamine 4-epimerase
VNVTAFLNILIAARDAGVRGFVYASSSAVYGDDPRMPKHEHQAGAPLSPYAATKSANELYAAAFCRCYGLSTVGLRYFNVFGPRQDPGGAYAAVIPAWIAAMIQGQPIRINGDGRTSRDFCHVANVVQANLLAATTVRPEAVNTVYNVAVHHRTTLNQLFRSLRSRLAPFYPHLAHLRPIHGPARAGDVRHSYADISRARRLLGYRPTHDFERGLDATLEWYRANLGGAGDESGQVRRSKRG